MIRWIGSAVLLFSVFFQFSCKDNPVELLLKDPRTLTWTVDTLISPGQNNFQTAMGDIWASSRTDVYVVGHSSNRTAPMFHYDGKQWSWVVLSSEVGGPIAAPFSLSAITGFSKDNIWAVGLRANRNPTPPPPFFCPD